MRRKIYLCVLENIYVPLRAALVHAERAEKLHFRHQGIIHWFYKNIHKEIKT